MDCRCSLDVSGLALTSSKMLAEPNPWEIRALANHPPCVNKINPAPGSLRIHMGCGVAKMGDGSC